MNVKLLRIVTGEEVIGELLSEDTDTITVKNGLVVIPNANSVGFKALGNSCQQTKT